MSQLPELTDEKLSRSLAYAGFVLVAFELVKSLIVSPIKAFYADMTFGPGMIFESYEADVRSRHKSEFEACLLYLRDFMEAIDSEDFLAIQGLRKHRNELAHDLIGKFDDLDSENYVPLLEKTDKALFKLSNYRTYMEIGADPAFRDRGIDWDTIYGEEYRIFKEIIGKMKLLRETRIDA